MPTVEDLQAEIKVLAERAEQYRWLLLEVCPWALPLVFYPEAVPLHFEEKIQRELDRHPARRPPLLLSPNRLSLELERPDE